MPLLEEFAPAKVNLSLRVLGRRSDGYHELESLVAFASVGDRLELHLEPFGEPSDAPFSLTVDGPFIGALEGENLIARADARLAQAVGQAGQRYRTGAFRLSKRLPVAAGLGGGSSDAAAALRLLRRTNPHLEPVIDWPVIAASLGADVPVCLSAQAALMTGIGEIVRPLPALPPIAILLANPRVPLATAGVFRALAARRLPGAVATAPLPGLADAEAVFDYLADRRNDLEPAARRLCAPVGTLLDRLATLPGARIVRMSGSGPTCFALFQSSPEAELAAARLAVIEPGWWIAAATLR